MKPLVFISHIHSEAEIAIWLKNRLTQLLLGAVDFFVSSDKTSIVAGDRWLKSIEDGIKKASVVIVLCSNDSVRRPWINFEAGGAWLSGKRVIPICHRGLFPSSLPEPLKSLQGLTLSDPQGFQDLLALLASEAGLLTPQFDAQEIVSTIPEIPETPPDIPMVNKPITQLSRQTLDKLFEKLQSTVVQVRIDAEMRASGFICSNNGLVLTADYAIREDVDVKPDIVFNDGETFTAHLVGMDTEAGLALLKLVDGNRSQYFDVAPGSAELFADVIALGYKDGLGWITASGRLVGKRVSETGLSQLQAQMEVSPGFGGAPVIDVNGQFVGVIHSKADPDACFITPSDTCASFLKEVTKNK